MKTININLSRGQYNKLLSINPNLLSRIVDQATSKQWYVNGVVYRNLSQVLGSELRATVQSLVPDQERSEWARVIELPVMFTRGEA